jgi:16S rRNA (guanine1516-N2)-methyltransferase
MIVTTVLEPTETVIARTVQLAEKLRCRRVPRNNVSVAKLQTIYDDLEVLVVSERELKYYHRDKPALFFHPSTALLRIKRLMKAESDVLTDISGAGEGDCILDCTAGLASDAIVFSYVVGARGQVTALESEPALALIVSEGLQRYESDYASMNEAMRRIQLVRTNHLDYIRALPDRSVDIVYFDPMFRSPVEESSSISPLREIANAHPLNLVSIEEARRIARKTVVMKEHRDSGEFARLGFAKKSRSHSNIAYGVIRCE